MKRLVTFICIAVLLMTAHAAGEVLSLDQCIQMAIEKDPQLIQSRNAVSSANAAVWNQAGQFLPSASVSYSSTEINSGPESQRTRPATITTAFVGEIVGDSVYLTPIFRDTLLTSGNPNDVKYKTHSAGISLNYTLFNGFQNVWNYMGSRSSKRQAEHDLTTVKSNIIFNVKTSYYLVLKAKRDLEVAQEAVKRTQELLKLFEEKYELGSASLSEVLKQKVQFGNDRLTEVRVTNNVKIYYDNLAVAIGMDPQVEFEIREIELRKESVDDLSTLIVDAKRWHPSILAARASTDAAKYDVRSAWGTYLPTLSLGYSYGWQKDHFSDIIKGGPFDHSASLRLSLNYTIFDGFGRERNLSRARLTQNNSKANLFYVQNQVIRNIEDAYLSINLSEETLSVTEETELAAKEDFDLVQEKYNLGAAALWELLDAQVSLKEAQFNKVKAEFDYNLALALLQNAIGE